VSGINWHIVRRVVDLTSEVAQKLLAAQPFSVLVGARVTAFGDGGATLELDIRPDLLQQNGFLHGGVLSYAADNALTFAGGTALGPEGVLLRAAAKVAYSSRRQATCTCELTTLDDAGTSALCAIAQGTIVAR
jgi:acyl-coenzyme A thioesterase PaaI-like protein